MFRSADNSNLEMEDSISHGRDEFLLATCSRRGCPASVDQQSRQYGDHENVHVEERVLVPVSCDAGNIVTHGGWKRRAKKGEKGPDFRICPSEMNAFENCVLGISERTTAEIFVPTEGTIFNSSQEAYEFYNMFSWEHGFGIRHDRTRFSSTGEYRLMHEIVCQCQGIYEKENAATCRTDCKSMIRLLRTDDHGWYVSQFLNVHNHPLSFSCAEKRNWNSHAELDPLAHDFIRKLRENNISILKVNNILSGVNPDSSAIPFRKQALHAWCAKLANEALTEDIPKTIKLLQEMRDADKNLVVHIDVDDDGRVR